MTKIFGSIEKLSYEHILENFDCGNAALNEYLNKYALINQKLRISQTYIGVSKGIIIGYYTISVASIQHDQAPKKVARGLPRYDIPVMLIGRLAVDLSFQERGVGAGLLKDAILRTQKVADLVGIRALIVHAKNDEVVQWYKKFDFEPSPLDSKHLFLLLKDMNNYCNN
ncbi:MAG: GNAT family N-acetyltransferase [Caedibacter sp. 38-128]|nr:MAG: GNAT family N-acetyltransferase [Caedibacter sp. 38-128]